MKMPNKDSIRDAQTTDLNTRSKSPIWISVSILHMNKWRQHGQITELIDTYIAYLDGLTIWLLDLFGQVLQTSQDQSNVMFFES